LMPIAIAAVATALATIASRRQTYHSLSALNDRTLQDIGLNRSMLMSMAMHGGRSPHDAEPVAKMSSRCS
jgi:uncharacterized protein YjiS (DUF1127 family)